VVHNETHMGEGGREFPLTTWGVVAQVGDTGDVRQAGLETLCHRYWKAVYCYVRAAWRTSNADAKDLTQGFFMWLVQARVLERYSADQGRFRHYLKGLLRNYVRGQRSTAGRIKRGGAAHHVALDNAELALAEQIPDTKSESPEAAFDRLWVEGLLERALLRAQTYFNAAGHELRVQIHSAYELASGEQPSYKDVARQLGVKAGDVRNHLHKMRERIRVEIRAELRETVRSPEDLETEWGELFQ
jgi:RNA polymerase sigma factor (sigma-70 family)